MLSLRGTKPSFKTGALLTGDCFVPRNDDQIDNCLQFIVDVRMTIFA